MTETSVKSRTMTGTVVSDKMDKTVAVMVERLVKHPVYGKYVRRSTKLLVHDEDNACQKGDVVAIQPCRPMSKRKSWKFASLIKSSEK